MRSQDLVQRWYEEMWNSWNEAIFDEILDPEITLRGSLGQVHRGYAGVSAYMRFVRAAFPDFHNRVEETVAQPPKVFARLTYTGTHRGEIFGVPPTGRSIQYAGAALFTLKEHRIRAVWVLGDLHGLIRQLQ